MGSTKEKVTPPASPLQNMKNPFITRLTPSSPRSFRSKNTVRVTILIIAIVVAYSVLSGIRCLKSGCISHIGFFGGPERSSANGHIGGGSVIGGSWKSDTENDETSTKVLLIGSGDDIVADSQNFREESPSAITGEGELMAPSAIVGMGREAGNGRWIDEDVKDKALREKLAKASAAKEVRPSRATALSKDTIEAEKEVVGSQSQSSNPPIYESGEHFKQNAADNHAKWEPGEGQEDPIRVKKPSVNESGNAGAGHDVGIGEMLMGSFRVAKA